MYKYLTALLIGLSTISRGQEVQELTPSITYLAEAILYFNMDNKEKGVEALLKVSKSDTNFVQYTAIAGQVNFENEKYKEAYENFSDLVEFATYPKLTHVYYKIRCAIELEKFDEANALIKEYKTKYPFHQRFKIAEAKVLEKKKDYEGAKKAYQAIIQEYNQCAEAHYELAKLMADEGQMHKACLGLMMVMANEYNDYSNDAFVMMEEILLNNYDKKRKSEDELFKKEDGRIKSKIAVKDTYKAKFQDIIIPVTNGIDMIMSSMKYKEGTNDFWMDYYVKYFVTVEDARMTNAMIMQSLSFSSADVVIQLLEGKYKSSVEKFNLKHENHFHEKQQAKKFAIKGKKYDLDYWYDGKDGDFYAVGEKKNGKQVGPWTYFYSDGTTWMELNFGKEENLDGVCKWYDRAGHLYQEVSYKNGEEDGSAMYAWSNKSKYFTTTIKNGKYTGKTEVYSPNGTIDVSYTLKNGERDGEFKEYSYTGDVLTECTYDNGKLNGMYTEYYNGGQKYSEVLYKKGQADGIYKKWYRNGAILEEGNYKNGVPTGEWKEYYRNGKVNNLTTFENGKRTGQMIEFYPNGDTSRIVSFADGELHGADYNYDLDGKLHSAFYYKKGKYKKHEYYGPNREVTVKGKKTISALDVYGFKYYEGQFKKGQRTGTFKYYWKNGEVESIRNYENGELQGFYKWFYSNGNIAGEVYYNQGYKHGKYVEYYQNGKVEVEGWYINGEKAGDWKYYNRDGVLSQEEYWLDGEQDKFMNEYHSNGKLHAISYYELGVIQYVEFYDTTGAKIQRNIFPQGNGDYTSNGIINKPYVSGTLKNGERDGSFKWLYPNGKTHFEYTYRMGFKHGPFKEYDPQGNLVSKGDYAYGYKNGKWQDFYENGKVSWEANYFYDEVKDSSVSYYYNGKVEVVKHYNVDGYLTKKDYYHDNGQLSSSIEYQNDRKHGTYDVYDREGNVMIRKTFVGGLFVSYSYLKNGKYVKDIVINGNGKVKAYYDNGKMSYSYEIRGNEYYGKFQKFYADGTVWEEESWKYGYGDGTHTSYFSNGKINTERSFKNGLISGKDLNYWDTTGNIESEEYYKNGDLHGVCKYYNEKGKLISTVTYWQGYVISVK